MAELWELAKLIRSKNAGPFELTFDILFANRDNFERVRASRVLMPQRFAEMYHVPEEEVRFFVHEGAMAFKISIPRPAFSGDPEDTDVFGGQFHSPLVRLEVDPDPGDASSVGV